MTAIRRPLPPLRRRQSDRATAHIPAFTASPAGEMHGVPRHPVSTIHVVRDVYVWGAVREGLSAARRLPYSVGVREDATRTIVLPIIPKIGIKSLHLKYSQLI